MFGYDTRLSMPWKDYFRRSNEDDLDDIEERIVKNEHLLDELSNRGSNDYLDNEVLGVQERILDLQDRREEIRFNAREREIEEEAVREEEQGRMEEELEEKDRRIEELESRLEHCEREDSEED